MAISLLETLRRFVGADNAGRMPARLDAVDGFPDRLAGLLALDALTYDPSTYEMLGVKTGIGDVTIARSGARYAQDVNGLYFSVPALERAINGGRVVQNRFRYSNGFTNAVWNTENGAVAVGETTVDGDTVMEVSFTTAAVDSFFQSLTLTVDNTYINSIYVRSKTGTGKIRARIGGTYSANIDIDTSWKRITVARTESLTSARYIGISNNNALEATTVYIRKAQLENSTGRTDTTTPSEYCPTDTIDSGDPTGYKVYANENGNSVASNVVTEGVGAALAEVPWLSACPAATNAQIRSNDLANAEWTASNMTVGDQDETGIDGGPTACTLTATAANATLIANAITASSDDQSTCWWLKRKTGTGNVDLSLDNGSTWTTVTLDSTSQKFTVDQAALANPQIGIRIVTDTDAVIVGNAECHLGKVAEEVQGLPPIFTVAAAVPTEADAATINLNNHDNTRGAYYLEWRPSYANQAHSVAQNILATGGGVQSLLYDTPTDTVISTNDGTSVASKTATWAAEDSIKIGVIYDAAEGKKRLCINGTWGTEPTYDGDYTLTTQISLFMSNLYANGMRNLQRYNLPYADAKIKIDELMA